MFARDEVLGGLGVGEGEALDVKIEFQHLGGFTGEAGHGDQDRFFQAWAGWLFDLNGCILCLGRSASQNESGEDPGSEENVMSVTNPKGTSSSPGLRGTSYPG